ncbi:penicillin-binding protein 2 [Pelodictyon luteolum]|uniref:Peptidoglycan glycosyltransferase n=1 Tax=Chlorobium luteolum (strain DSM 273 / BCRC 81028 / 2530) TaxID=319225 RepID=Q3B5C7_CHLL3|nr:penicillin-binding protein 2 [Pelodictyon luteolum]ABB23454.1 peptidoglycan glycosyltransferase [Pelodictyon luteolum DSM 273]
MDRLQHSTRIVSILIVTIFAVLLGRLFWIQVLDFQKLGSISSSNSIRRVWIQPPRGRIIDRNDIIMVDNRPLYSVKVIPAEFNDSGTEALAWLIRRPMEEVAEKIERGRNFNRFSAVTLRRDLESQDVERLGENLWELPGVLIEAENKRKYADSRYGAHLFGYLRQIARKDVAELVLQGYAQDDKIGFSGLEKQYEDRLKGTKGARFEMVTPLGRYAGKYDDGRSDIPAVRGDDLYLTIDSGLQQLAGELLEATGKSGAIIAIDPSTGGILALESAPGYDLETFNGATDPDGWRAIISDPRKPLFNRTVQAVYPPGSIYKMVLAMAALEGNRIDPEQKVLDNGVFTYGRRRFLSHGGRGHGWVNMRRAITVSSNLYFYRLIFDVGFAEWTRYGAMFGFGTETGIDLPGERSGLLPSTAYYDRRYGKGRWTKGYLVSLAIGQGELGATPVQLAAYAAAIANGGTLHQPHIASGYRDTETGRFVPLPSLSRPVPVSEASFRLIRESMEEVVREGTGQLAAVPGVRVAGKTGTAQNPGGKDHAWFIAFAPVDNPKIAIAVLAENAGFGGTISAPIAGKLIQHYLHPVLPSPPAADSLTVSGPTPETSPDSLGESLPVIETAPPPPEAATAEPAPHDP